MEDKHRKNFIPKLYAQTNFFQTRDALKLINDIALDFKDCHLDTILDIGCGPATQTYKLFQKLKPRRMVAFDFSDGMIHEAKTRYQNINDDQESEGNIIEFYQGSASEDFIKLSQKLNIKPGTVDLIFSTYCIHWISQGERQNFVGNIQKFLKPGGMFYLLKYTWSDVMPLSYNFINHQKWHSYIIERAEKITGYKLIEKNLEHIIGFYPLEMPREIDDYNTWKVLFDKERLYIDKFAFVRNNFEFNNLENSINQFNQPFWRTFIQSDKLDEFDSDYHQYLIDNFIEPQSRTEAELQKFYNGNLECKLRFNYIYTLLVGRKFSI